MNASFSLNNRKSKLGHSLEDILFDEKNDELSYFVLYMDTKNACNYVKFLLDVNNFKLTSRNFKNKIESDEYKENIEFVNDQNVEFNYQSNFSMYFFNTILIVSKILYKMPFLYLKNT